MNTTLKVEGLSEKRLAYTNHVYISETANFKGDQKMLVSLNGGLIFFASPHAAVNPGSIALNALQRRSCNFALNTAVQIEPYTPPPNTKFLLGTVLFEIETLAKNKNQAQISLSVDELTENMMQNFEGHFVQVGQKIATEVAGKPFLITVGDITHSDLAGSSAALSNKGQLTKVASVSWKKGKESNIKLTGQGTGTSTNLLQPKFNFEDLGIGGLDNEFSQIFRKAFASRVLPAEVVAKMGIPHVKGMLLFGPPGCGKTLIARQIAKTLNAREPKIVNGPEILDKFVGASEENMRALFADAEAEYAESGDESELHIIIFDEIDAVCKARGSSRDGVGVHDSLVNQLLTKIDGVDSLNNILVIGMTNRKDLIDPAILRPGRMEVHVEIGLPDHYGRTQILRIHTSKLRSNNMLDDEVVQDVMAADSKEFLATETKNYTGAEMASLVTRASSYAINRKINPKNGTANLKDASDIKVYMDDFKLALAELPPKFGLDEDDLGLHFENGICDFGPKFADLQTTFTQFVTQMHSSDKTPLLTVMLEGDHGSGKTALATKVAVDSRFPFVRLISPDMFIGMHESSKCAKIFDIFQDAWKSPLSIVILDDIERLIDYTPIGPRFSNQVLQALLILSKKRPPDAGKKLMVIGLTSSPDLRSLGLTDAFNICLKMPTLSQAEEVAAVVRFAMDNPNEKDADEIGAATVEAVGDIAVKKLLLVIEMAREGAKLETHTFLQCLNATTL